MPFDEHYRRKIADGSLENSDDFKQQQQYMRKVLIPKSSEQLKQEKERERTWMDAIIKLRELVN